jgi:hypothetical protein
MVKAYSQEEYDALKEQHIKFEAEFRGKAVRREEGLIQTNEVLQSTIETMKKYNEELLDRIVKMGNMRMIRGWQNDGR